MKRTNQFDTTLDPVVIPASSAAPGCPSASARSPPSREHAHAHRRPRARRERERARGPDARRKV